MAANKHQQKTETTRRKLLEAALRVFARDGFEAARIEDIAAEAGHSRGAFYANFDTKVDLFFAILEKTSSERLTDLTTRLEKCRTVPQRLTTLRKFYLERAKDRQSVLLTLEFKLFALRHPKMRAQLAASHRRIRASLNYSGITRLLPLRGSQQEHELDKVVFEVVLTGLVLEHAYDPQRISAKHTTETLGRAFDLLIRS
jgi:AcrR family transcriptional regulator